MLEQFAADIVRIGRPPPDHLGRRAGTDPSTPSEAYRAASAGSKPGLARLAEEEAVAGRKISRGICFTISQYSYKGLGVMPEVARSLGIDLISIVPY